MITIDVEDRVKIAKLNRLGKQNYKKNTETVINFIDMFKNKYSRHPSDDEIIDNTAGINRAELKTIINELNN